MTVRTEDRGLLWIGLVIAGTYLAASCVLPGVYIVNLSSISIAAFGALTLWKYISDAYAIVVHGDRSRASPGAHLAVLGTALMAFGAVYIGAYSLLFYWLGQPENWRGTAWGGIGRMCIAGGFWLMYLSPDVSRQGVKLPAVIWTSAAIAIALIAAYHIGVRVGEYRTQ
jgi:hypothetical protein